MDDEVKKAPSLMDQLEKEDIDQLSIDELEERIEIFRSQIDRYVNKIERKKTSKASAESFFK